MKEFETNLDRPQLDPERIRSHQDFDKVLKAHKLSAKSQAWQQRWLWGGGATACVAGAVSLALYTGSPQQEETGAELAQVSPSQSQVAEADQAKPMSETAAPKTNEEPMVTTPARKVEVVPKPKPEPPQEHSPKLDKDPDVGLAPPREPVAEQVQELTISAQTTDEVVQEVVAEQDDFSMFELQPTINDSYDYEVSIPDLIDAHGIQTRADVDILGFTMIADGNDSYEVVGNNWGDEGTVWIHEHIRPGDIIRFENIRSRASNGTPVVLPSVLLKVIN